MNPQRVDHMILIDSPATSAKGNFSVMTDAYFEPPLGELLSHFQSDKAIRRGLAQGFASLRFPVPQSFVADMRQAYPTPAFRHAHEESIAYRSAKPPYERIAALQPLPPLLVIFGTRDAIVPPDEAKFFQRVPGAKVTMIAGAGHSPMVESPGKVLDLIQSFLRPAS